MPLTSEEFELLTIHAELFIAGKLPWSRYRRFASRLNFRKRATK